MNWKLIVQLSLFGFAMGIATVFVISSNAEPLFWLGIFLVSAYLIAVRSPGRPFVHGVMVGFVNGLWVTGFHILFAAQYLANHPQEASMMASMPLPTHPRVMMALIGPCIGLLSGIVLGLLAFIVTKLIARRAAGIPDRLM